MIKYILVGLLLIGLLVVVGFSSSDEAVTNPLITEKSPEITSKGCSCTAWAPKRGQGKVCIKYVCK